MYKNQTCLKCEEDIRVSDLWVLKDGEILYYSFRTMFNLKLGSHNTDMPWTLVLSKKYFKQVFGLLLFIHTQG